MCNSIYIHVCNLYDKDRCHAPWLKGIHFTVNTFTCVNKAVMIKAFGPDWLHARLCSEAILLNVSYANSLLCPSNYMIAKWTMIILLWDRPEIWSMVDVQVVCYRNGKIKLSMKARMRRSRIYS